MESNWLDNLIGFFNPRAKQKRVLARYQLEQYNKVLGKRKYDGAGSGRRFEGWNTSGTSANSEIERGLISLRNRSRDLRRNNPYAARGIQLITSNVIGKGIRSQISVPSNPREKRLRNLWTNWAQTPAIDFDGQKDIFAIQNMIMDAVVESGEVLIRRRRVIPTPENPLPIQLQILESDFLDTNLTSFQTKGGVLINGIEIGDDGKRISYRIFEEHPGSFNVTIKGNKFRTLEIPAEDILHIYRADRPGQMRGAPWLAPAMMRLRDLDDYEDAQIMRQKIAACWSVFITDLEQGDNLTKEQIDDLERVEPGNIEILGAGKDVRFANPPGVQNYGEYTSQVLHAIATGMGVSFEGLTGDLSQVNFSSARMGFLEFNRNIETWRHNIIIGQFMGPVFRWFLEGAFLVGENINGASIKHIPPKREMVDPTKEIPAKIKSIRAGIENLSDAILENGRDPEEAFAQKAIDNKKIDDLDLILDTDPRKVSIAGIGQDSLLSDGEQDSEDS